ncbi:MAG TPA: DedA family protein [Gemmatimonadales bacterium]|nr:DedA family protein [Gemmatimonadales bacterium]
MRRHPVLLLYLILLGASTLVRWRLGAFTRTPPPPAVWDRGEGSPVVVLAEEGSYANDLRLITGLGLTGHHTTVVWGSADPRPFLTGHPVHLIAFGTLGPEAIALGAERPDGIRSLTLIDAAGVEEFDLLGDHHLDQILRHAGVVFLATARTLVPHFGLLDLMTWRAELRMRRMSGYDRRGIRGALARWTGPTEIFVADSSRNSLATAREHARLLPQATLGAWDPDSLAPFLDRVDAGTAVTRATAPPERIAAAALPFDAHGIPSAEGIELFIVLVLLALTTLLSEDLACVTAGVLAARGSIPLVPAIVACYVGIIVGDQLLYLLGRSAGRVLVTRIPVKWILPAERLDRACEWFQSNGMKVVLTSRFLPGTRFPVYVAAGILRGGFVRFALWLMAIGAIWTPVVVGFSYEATRRGRSVVERLPGETWVWALGLIVGATLLLRGVIPLLTAEGRRQAAARWHGGPGGAPKSPLD